MKKQMLLVALAAALSLQVGAAVPDKQPAAAEVMKPMPGQTQAALWASRVLSRYHYKATPLDDAMSEKIFDRYFKALDAEKLFTHETKGMAYTQQAAADRKAHV